MLICGKYIDIHSDDDISLMWENLKLHIEFIILVGAIGCKSGIY